MYKICVLAAGKGTRNKYAANSHKALLPLGNGTVLSHIVSRFPGDMEIVMAVGYNAHLIKQYACTQWGDRVTFVDVEYEGDRKGPGYSLYQCSPVLQRPFVYVACDTVVEEHIPPPKRNWIGITLVNNPAQYLTVDLGDGNTVSRVYDKGNRDASCLASIGLVGVSDYKPFFDALARPHKAQGEEQDSAGLRALIPFGLYMENQFHWLDTGNTEGYEDANRRFSQAISI